MSRAYPERGRGGWGGALVASAAAHAAALAVAVMLARRPLPVVVPPPVEPAPSPRLEIDLAAPPARPSRHAAARARAHAGPDQRALAPDVKPAAPGGGVDLALRGEPGAHAGGGAATGRPGSPPPGAPARDEPGRAPPEDVPRVQKRPGFIAHVDDDGSVHFEDRVPHDANDAIMRMFGMDPYSYEKRKFADETRPARERMADAARAAWRADALARLPSTLERLWRDTRLPAAARRRALFDLWDECLDPPETPAGAAGDDADPTVAGAARARRIILDMIRTHLPAGSPDAFTPAELDTLNRRRRSRARFAPYDETAR